MTAQILTADRGPEPVEVLAAADPPPPLFTFELSKITQPILRSAAWIAGILVGSLALALVVFLLTKPQYIAEATVRIDANAQRVVLTDDQQTEDSARDGERSLETTLEMARSASVRDAVARELQLFTNGDFLEAMGRRAPEGDPANLRRAVSSALEDGMSAQLVGSTRIAAIGFSSPDPILSARVANSFARNLIRLDLQQRAGRSDFARSFLQGELEKLRGELRNSEGDANAYARAAAIVALSPETAEGQSKTLTSEALTSVNQQLSAAAAKRIEEEANWRAIADRDPLSIPQVVANTAVQQLVAQRSQVGAELDAARARHGERHPEVLSLAAKQSELAESLSRLANQIKRGLRAPYEAATREEQTLQGRLGQLRSDQLSEQDRAVNLSILQRETATKRDQYDALLDRYNEVTAQAGAQVSNLALLDPASPPAEPYWPRLPVLLVAALVLGGILSVAFVVARELFFSRLHQPDDLPRRAGLPVIGAVPLAEGDFYEALESRLSPINEAYGEALASLTLASATGLPRSLVVSSSASGDGKSTSVFALARAIGATGRSVVVIDGDMRRPTQHTLFNLANTAGLSTLLTSDQLVDSVLLPTSFANVSLIPAGPRPPQPAELLSRSRAADIVAEAARKFDVVLIDSPPVVGFADPLLLGAAAEAAVLIGRADRTRPAVLRAAADKLRGANVNLVGAILTFYRRSRQDAYAYYAYRDGDGAMKPA